MKLIVSSGNPWHTNYCAEDGQIIYKVESNLPSVLGQQLMKIAKVCPPVLPPEGEDDRSIGDAALKDTFAEIGEVEYHVVGNSRIKYEGRDESTASWFRKEGLWFYGSARVFEGPDKKKYAWRLTDQAAKLSLHLPKGKAPNNEDSSEGEVPVATYNHRDLNTTAGEGQKPYLEIFPAGECMRDLIVITFLYVWRCARLDGHP